MKNLREYFKVFEVALLSTRDKKRWLDILSRFDRKDPHYLPGYLEIYEKEINTETFMHFGGQGMLFVYGDSRNFIIYPFFKRSLSYLPFSDTSVDGLYDIVSPYGYGGPLAQVEDESVSEELWWGFFNTFDDFCKENNIVSEFCRLHPFFGNHEPVGNFSKGVTQQLGRIIYVDLSYSEEEILRAMSRKRRYQIRKAERDQYIEFSIDAGDNDSQCFFDLYTHTMQRAGAENKYFFPQHFFDAAFRSLNKNMSFPHIIYKNETISGELLIKYGALVYTWLSGSKSDYLHLRPNELLVYRSLLQSKKEGLRYFILGGGISGEDSLFSFKASFSKSLKDFYVYKKIYLEKEYKELVELKRKYSGKISDDFFPQYRTA